MYAFNFFALNVDAKIYFLNRLEKVKSTNFGLKKNKKKTLKPNHILHCFHVSPKGRYNGLLLLHISIQQNFQCGGKYHLCIGRTTITLEHVSFSLPNFTVDSSRGIGGAANTLLLEFLSQVQC